MAIAEKIAKRAFTRSKNVLTSLIQRRAKDSDLGSKEHFS